MNEYNGKVKLMLEDGKREAQAKEEKEAKKANRRPRRQKRMRRVKFRHCMVEAQFQFKMKSCNHD